MKTEKKWIITISHINTNQLSEEERNEKNDWNIKITTIQPKKRKTKKKKQEPVYIRSYNYKTF